MRQFKLMLMVLFSTLLFCSPAWSLDRFVDLNDGTMLDTSSSLRWLKNANCFEAQKWDAAISSAASLAAPSCGLSDGSAAGDWHLPAIEELRIFVDAGYRYNTLTTAGFSNVQANIYWSSSTYAGNTTYAWNVDLIFGLVNVDDKPSGYYVWPVRAGQHWSLDPLVISGGADFGSVPVGSTSPGHQFTLKNSSSSSLSVTSIALSGTDSDQFTLATGGTTPCSSLASLTLAGSASCTVLVSAKPTIFGSKSANLTVSSGGSSVNVPLTATGAALSVTYNGNGNSSGSLPLDSTGYALNATATVLDNSGGLAKSGYAFNGWNTAADGSGTSYQPGATFTISADTVLYAKWAAAIASPAGLISWWRGEGTVVDSVGGNTGTSHLGTGIVTATVAENATATLTCDSGETIVSYSSTYGAGSSTISCGSCTIGANSCSVTYSNANCTDPAIGTAKSGTLSLTCTVSTGAFPIGKVAQAIRFNGSSEYVTQDKTYKGIASSSASSSFTMEFWAKPTATITNLAASQTTSGYAGTSGQRYAIFPEMQDSTTEAGAGVSVGTNGIMVTEHAGDYLPAPLVYPLVDGDMPSDGWLHIAVVYESQTPKLYVNGVLKQTGLSSGRTVYPSSQFGGTSYGFYSGLLDELHIFSRALTVTEIQSIYNAGPAGLALTPTITAITPSSGPASGGTTVTITGSNLTGATAVKFGSTAATSFTVNSDSQISAVAPAGSAGTVDITVTTPVGTSVTSNADQFTYLVSAPTATTLAASSVTGTTATLNGRISANNYDTTVTFEYGTSSSYGSTAAASPDLVSGDLNTAVSATIGGLTVNTTYHYRVKGSSMGGTTYGDDMTFTTPACELLSDGSFEGGSPSAYWAEASTNFGTPLCTFGTCGGPSDAVRTGNWWAWFGGIKGADEVGSMTQSVLIPVNSLPRLNFYLYNQKVGSNGTDFLKVFVDGNEVFGMLAGNPAYTGGYTLVDLDLSSYADGMCHTLSFQSTTHTSTSDGTNIFVDDVAIPHCSSTVRIDAVPSVSLQQAMNAAGNLSVISATAHVFTGDLLFSQPGRVTFKGGYDCSFSQNSGYTTIDGKLAISGAGTLVVEKMIIK